MSRKWLVVVGILVFLGTAITHAPVASVYAWLAPKLAGSPVQALGISGSLSQGQVSQLGYLGRPLARDVAWEFKPLWLLLGRLAFQLSGGSEGLVVDGRASATPLGSVALSAFRLAGPLKPLLVAVGQPAPLAGQVGTDLKSFTLTKGWPTHADGVLRAQSVAWALGRDPVPLGDYEAQLADDTGGVKATIRTLGGPLEITGTLQMAADRTYELDVQMKPKPDAAPLVVNLVRNVGQPDPQGWYHVKRKGSMGAASTGAPPPLPGRGAQAIRQVDDGSLDEPSGDDSDSGNE